MFRVLGFRCLGFSLGFMCLEFWVLGSGFRVQGL